MEMLITEEYLGGYGHVHHSYYEKIFDEAFGAHLESIGLSFTEIAEIYGLRCVQRFFSIEYIHPLYLGERISLETKIESVGITSLTVIQRIIRNGVITTSTRTVYVATRYAKKEAIPRELRDRLM